MKPPAAMSGRRRGFQSRRRRFDRRRDRRLRRFLDDRLFFRDRHADLPDIPRDANRPRSLTRPRRSGIHVTRVFNPRGHPARLENPGYAEVFLWNS